MHLCRKSRINRIVNVLVENLRRKTGTRIIAVNLRRKHRERTQINSISILKHIKAVVADRNSQNVADTRRIAGCRTHPGDVMISPLNVDIVELHQLIHDDVRARSSIKDVSDDVQIVNRQVLDQLTDCRNELVCNLRVNDRTNDFPIIYPFILIIIIHMKQFVDDVGELLRHLFSDFGAGVF